MHDKKRSISVHITGLVQGVGFRPFVYRLAGELGIAGSVRNQTDGVWIHAEGAERAVVRFVRDLRERAPAAAAVETVHVTEADSTEAAGFTIVDSAESSAQVTRISPDLPVCDDCLADMRRDPRRISYPFTNCTNCGPRFSIVTALPYDRAHTTMQAFAMCRDCRSEYEDVLDRRFHAQPVACRRCGPKYTLVPATCEPGDDRRMVEELAAPLDDGRIVAMKGIGGFHLACDATNPYSVARLRSRKRREGKPFAVMFASLDAVQDCAPVSPAERDLLLSSARPIVLLDTCRRRTDGADRRPGPERALAAEVSNGLGTVGAILPYMPIHHLLFEHLATRAIVLTSGNLSAEPIVVDNTRAARVLGPVADLLLTHDREIANRQDDSVAMVVNGEPRLLRRSRGYVPDPVRLPLPVDGIVGMGGDQKTTLCFGSADAAIMSQHIGDLDDPGTLEFYRSVLGRFPALFRVRPRLMAVDAHPDYISTAVALESGLPTVAVQHHHAHIASCMAEHGLSGRVIGIALDGTGYGDDGAIWGGEFLIGDYAGYERYAHLDYVPLPGGDLAVHQPWRSALSWLLRAFGPDGPPDAIRRSLAVYDDAVVSPAERTAAAHAISTGINAPLTSSAGRLFDAVSALCGICLRSGFDAEAPMRLADCLAPDVEDCYPFRIVRDGGSSGPDDHFAAVIQFDETIRRIAAAVGSGDPVGLISARFHNTICESLVAVARTIRRERDLDRVVLSGGVFQNRYLLSRCERRLGADGFEVHAHRIVPSNDGGLSLGQVAIAAGRETEE